MNMSRFATKDPLGVGARQKALDRRQAEFNRGELAIGGLLGGMGMDSRWDGFLEQMNGTKTAEGTPFNGPDLRSVQNPGQYSNQMGGAGMVGAMVRGLDAATAADLTRGGSATKGLNTQMPISSRMGNSYQNHDQWMALNKGKR